MGGKTAEKPENLKRSRILKTAQKMFVEQGYAGVSMEALARAVPVSKPTLYNHFRDKKTLFTAVMENRCIFISSRIRQILLDEDKDVEQALIAMGEQFLSVVFHYEAINIYRTTITQVQNFPELGKLFYESGPLRCMKIFSEYLERLHSERKLNIPNAKRAANIFFGMLVGRTQLRLLLGVDKKISAKEIREHTRYVVDVFLHGQQPRR